MLMPLPLLLECTPRSSDAMNPLLSSSTDQCAAPGMDGLHTTWDGAQDVALLSQQGQQELLQPFLTLLPIGMLGSWSLIPFPLLLNPAGGAGRGRTF